MLKVVTTEAIKFTGFRKSFLLTNGGKSYRYPGAKGTTAAGKYYRQAIKTSLIPLIDGLMTVGIVQFLGLMTGQVISDADPTRAVSYQVIIMYTIAAAKCLAAIVGLRFYANSFFNKGQQLVAKPY